MQNVDNQNALVRLECRRRVDCSEKTTAIAVVTTVTYSCFPFERNEPQRQRPGRKSTALQTSLSTNLEASVDRSWHVGEHPLERARAVRAEQPERNQPIAFLKPFLVAHVSEGTLNLTQPPVFSRGVESQLFDPLQLQLFVQMKTVGWDVKGLVGPGPPQGFVHQVCAI